MNNFLLPAQIIFFIFILFAVSRAILRYKDGEIHFGALFFWVFIWVSASLAVFSPEKTTQLARALGIGRGVDVIVYLSLALLFYLVFRLHVLIENLETKISKLIREITLKDTKASNK